MKTSNILMTAAILIFLSTLLAYDFGLRAEYLTMKKLGLSNYNLANRFNEYEEAAVKNFDNIELKAANSFNVSIEYGEKEAVWVSNHVKEKIQVNQIGKDLIIDLSNKAKKENYTNSNLSIVIISPKIRRINTYPFTFVNKENDFKTVKETRNYGWGTSIISGFNQDSLILNVSGFTGIEIKSNNLKSLDTKVGDDSGEGSLVIQSDNNVEAINLQAQRKSKVEVLDTDVLHLKTQISDEAIVTFRGKVLTKLNKN